MHKLIKLFLLMNNVLPLINRRLQKKFSDALKSNPMKIPIFLLNFDIYAIYSFTEFIRIHFNLFLCYDFEKYICQFQQKHNQNRCKLCIFIAIGLHFKANYFGVNAPARCFSICQYWLLGNPILFS